MNPLILGALALGSYYVWKHPLKGTAMGADTSMTPARSKLIHQLLNTVHSPAKLERAAELCRRHGAHKGAKALLAKAKQVRQQGVVAGELVEQARCGDQNALGTIVAIREQAKAGSPRAVVSAKLMHQYMDKHPAPEVKVDDPELHRGAYAAGVAPPPEEQPGETPQSFEGVE